MWDTLIDVLDLLLSVSYLSYARLCEKANLLFLTCTFSISCFSRRICTLIFQFLSPLNQGFYSRSLSLDDHQPICIILITSKSNEKVHILGHSSSPMVERCYGAVGHTDNKQQAPPIHLPSCLPQCLPQRLPHFVTLKILSI